MRRVAIVVVVLLVSAMQSVRPAIASTTSHCSSGVSGDFNGDGTTDLAVGVPLYNVGLNNDAGAVNVIYGSASGLSANGSQLWVQGTTAAASGVLLGTSQAGDRFGSCLAAGDFNGDGLADLAVGVPGEDIGAAVDGGAVNVIYGGPNGLTAAGNQFWFQGKSGLSGRPNKGDTFGAALAAGDFNRDGKTDLAIGIPNKKVAGSAQAGAVQILYGSKSGLKADGNQIWSQSRRIGGVPEAGDHFGTALAAGDFNGDGRSDLAVGVPDEDVGSIVDAGAVNVIYGTSSGLASAGGQLWYQDVPGIRNKSQTLDRFGASLAAGDFNGDGSADLAIGVPGKQLGTASGAGAVNVIYGSKAGLDPVHIPSQFWRQGSDGIADSAESGDAFGATLATGRFNVGIYADLVVGVPLEDNPSIDEGAINVIYGSADGLVATGNQFLDQDSTTASTGDVGRQGDIFASSLTTGDYNGDAFSDVVVGIPSKTFGPTTDMGAAIAIYGSAAGLDPTKSQLWDQDTAGIPGSAQIGAQFGAAVG